MSAKRYLVTIWLHNQDVITEENHLQAFQDSFDRGGIRFFVYQLEQCPGTGRRHFQCYLEFSKPQRGSSIASKFGLTGDSVRFETARGSCDENIRYCTKEESRLAAGLQLGTPGPGQGARSDIQRAVSLLKDHGIRRVAEEEPCVFVKFHKGLSALQSALRTGSSQSFNKREVIVVWGPTGTGKTRFAYDSYGQQSFFRVPPAIKGNQPWFDGYIDQETVLIDDYGGDSLYPLPFLLQLLDGYAMQVPVKGGFVEWTPKRVIITSNLEPKYWYQGAPNEQQQAMARRFTHVQDMSQISVDESQ